MEVIGHYDVAIDEMSITFQIVKPFVDYIIAIRNLKELEPAGTGDGDKINSIIFIYRSAYWH